MTDGSIRVWLRSRLAKARTSLFWIPSAYIVVAIVAALTTWSVDRSGRFAAARWLIDADAQTAQSVLQAVATASITVAGLVFPVMVVALQLASSQFSPRVLRGFLRDRVIQHALGIVVATFAFSILMLSSTSALRGQREGEAQGSIAVTLAVVLAIAALVAIVEFIHHAARYMQVVEIIRRTTMETRALIAQLLPQHDPGRHVTPVDELPVPQGESRTVRSRHDGWVQQIDAEVLLRSLPARTTVRVDVRPGEFVVEQQPICTIWFADDVDDPDELDEDVWESFAIGSTRTMQQDIVYGIRQLVDIALRAMSPAINDPTTAFEVTVNLGAILRDILTRDLRPRVGEDDEGRVILRPHELDHGDYVAHAFDQIRLAVAGHPVAAINLLRTVGMLVRLLRDAELVDRVPPLLEQADLVVAAVEATAPLLHDLAKVRREADAIPGVEAPTGPLADDAAS